jgi:hypothetical protein
MWLTRGRQIGRAGWWERGWARGELEEGAASFKKKKTTTHSII